VLAWVLAEPEADRALTIGRLLKGGQGWKVDPTFQPQRSR
jgi:hypothetical protein